MSGLEIAGVVLGAFPLLISGMDHYQDTKKFTESWWRINRVHRKDLRNLKFCNLQFRAHLKELLIPLLLHGNTDQKSYEELLANPGGPGWREENIDEALAKRLSEHHETYLELLEELQQTMVKLSVECRVADRDFQAGIRRGHYQTQLSLYANVRFQFKRAAYTMAGLHRDALLREVEDLIEKLQETLAANDRVNAVEEMRPRQPPQPKVFKAVLQAWRHAETIFKLVSKVWCCPCPARDQTTLWLKNQTLPTMDMVLLMHFCHGPSCVHFKLLEKSDQAVQPIAQTAPFVNQPTQSPMPGGTKMGCANSRPRRGSTTITVPR